MAHQVSRQIGVRKSSEILSLYKDMQKQQTTYQYFK